MREGGPQTVRSLASVLFLCAALVSRAPGAAGAVREPALAGAWYPPGRASLAAAARLLMRIGVPGAPVTARPAVLVVPHAGWNYSGAAAGTAFRLLARGSFERVVVVGPSHHTAFSGYALDDATAYRTPLGDVPLCAGANGLLAGNEARLVPGAGASEHSVEIELPFLQAALGRFCLVPVLVGDTGPEAERAFAARLARLHDGRTLFVFSSDFSHYGTRFGWSPFGKPSPTVKGRLRELNDRAAALLSRVDAAAFRAYLRETGNTICGRNGLATMLELLPLVAPAARALTLAHYASSDIPGLEDDGSVSYLALAFLTDRTLAADPAALLAPPRLEDAPAETPALSREEGARLVRLARAALATELLGGDDVLRELEAYPQGPGRERRQGVFVTLNRTAPDEVRALGKLRGCIGQPEPAFPLYYGTVTAALDAALRDPRFPPVRAEELPRLALEVSVLSPRRAIGSWREIEIGRHGIVLQKGDKAALFLPQVAPEQGWNVEQALDALAEKAGLPRGAWRSGARLSVFTGQAFEESR